MHFLKSYYIQEFITNIHYRNSDKILSALSCNVTHGWLFALVEYFNWWYKNILKTTGHWLDFSVVMYLWECPILSNQGVCWMPPANSTLYFFKFLLYFTIFVRWCVTGGTSMCSALSSNTVDGDTALCQAKVS